MIGCLTSYKVLRELKDGYTGKILENIDSLLTWLLTLRYVEEMVAKSHIALTRELESQLAAMKRIVDASPKIELLLVKLGDHND